MIPAKLYKKIVELVPILCVDVVLVYKNKYVLIKRTNEPLKGQWWVVGGRALKGEKTLAAAKRKIKEETGLTGYIYRLLGVYEDSYPKSAFGVPTSSVSVVYEARITNLSYTLDETSSELKLSDTLPRRFLNKLKHA